MLYLAEVVLPPAVPLPLKGTAPEPKANGAQEASRSVQATARHVLAAAHGLLRAALPQPTLFRQLQPHLRARWPLWRGHSSC